MSVVDWVSIPSDEMTADGVPCALGMHMLKHHGRFGQMFHVPTPPPPIHLHPPTFNSHSQTHLPHVFSSDVHTHVFSVSKSVMCKSPWHYLSRHCCYVAATGTEMDVDEMWYLPFQPLPNGPPSFDVAPPPSIPPLFGWVVVVQQYSTGCVALLWFCNSLNYSYEAEAMLYK